MCCSTRTCIFCCVLGHAAGRVCGLEKLTDDVCVTLLAALLCCPLLRPRSKITENTRASYPIEYIENARIPCVGPHPRNVVLLCCDAFGVLPPVSRLSLEQVMYHFISGYTSKVRPSYQ